jgi:hypothetical protein
VNGGTPFLVKRGGVLLFFENDLAVKKISHETHLLFSQNTVNEPKIMATNIAICRKPCHRKKENPHNTVMHNESTPRR